MLRKIGVGEQKTTPAEVDTRGLAPGDYRGLIKIRCLTCPPPPKCVQDVTELEVRLHIPTEEERFDPVPGGSLPETDPDGDDLLYTLLYSDDGGQTWVDFAFEREETSGEIVVGDGDGPHLAWVLVTDGARSGEVRIELSL